MMRGFDPGRMGVDAIVTKDRGLFPLKESVKALLERRHLTARQNDAAKKLKLLTARRNRPSKLVN